MLQALPYSLSAAASTATLFLFRTAAVQVLQLLRCSLTPSAPVPVPIRLPVGGRGGGGGVPALGKSSHGNDARVCRKTFVALVVHSRENETVVPVLTLGPRGIHSTAGAGSLLSRRRREAHTHFGCAPLPEYDQDVPHRFFQ